MYQLIISLIILVIWLLFMVKDSIPYIKEIDISLEKFAGLYFIFAAIAFILNMMLLIIKISLPMKIYIAVALLLILFIVVIVFIIYYARKLLKKK